MSAIDSVNLYASNLYGQIQNQQITRSPDSSIIQAENNFQKMVDVNFNSFAKLSQEQILGRISNSRALGHNPAAYTLDISSNVSGSVNLLRETLNRQEVQAKKASIGEANLVELMTTNTQATAILSSFIAIKDSAKESWEKIWSMAL
ncbi:MAG: hypothetical protein SFT91_01605 [Rickettsiaceae bacterium]|nr:hypothetical protein [Rickettsiaceae bacterium]